jgi:hypothetical protein
MKRFMTFTVVLLLTACNGGGGGGGDGAATAMPVPTADVAGVWWVTEHINNSACGVQDRTVNFHAAIVQADDSGNLTIDLPSGTFNGAVTGNTVRWMGSYFDAKDPEPANHGWMNITDLSFSVKGDSMSGWATWEFRKNQNTTFICSGTSQVFARRVNGGTATVPVPPGADEIVASLTEISNALRGDELFTQDLSFSFNDINFTMGVLGFAFCAPVDYYQTPLSSPAPGQTVYGCPNALMANYQLDADRVTIAFTSANLYIDARGFYSSLFIPRREIEAYAVVANPVLTVSYELTPLPFGLYRLGQVTHASATLGTVTVGTNPSLMFGLFSFFEPWLDNQANIVASDVAMRMAETYAANAPLFVLP